MGVSISICSRNRVRLSATWFYTRVVSITAFDSSGVIRPATDPYGRTSGYINGSGGVSRGAELAVEARPLKTLTFVRFVYLRQREYGSRYLGRGVLEDSRRAGQYGVTRRHVSTGGASWTLRSRYSVAASTTCRSSPGHGRGRSSSPASRRGTLVASYRLWESERRSVRLYGKADNVFNQRYYQNGWLAAQGTMLVGFGYGF